MEHRKYLSSQNIDLDESERRQLEKFSAIRLLPARTTISRPGERLSYCTFLLEGSASRFRDDRNGLRQIVSIHFPGEFLDIELLCLEALDSAFATVTAATVGLIPHAALESMCHANPNFRRKLWAATTRAAALHRAWLFRLGRLDATGRVAHFLSESGVRLNQAGDGDGRRFALGLTQGDIAEICGLTNIHVNRVLSALRKAGLCTVHAGQVEIFDPVALAARGQFNPSYLQLEAATPHTHLLNEPTAHQAVIPCGQHYLDPVVDSRQPREWEPD